MLVANVSAGLLAGYFSGIVCSAVLLFLIKIHGFHKYLYRGVPSVGKRATTALGGGGAVFKGRIIKIVPQDDGTDLITIKHRRHTVTVAASEVKVDE